METEIRKLTAAILASVADTLDMPAGTVAKYGRTMDPMTESRQESKTKDRWRVVVPDTAGTGRWSHRISTASSPELMPLQSGLTQNLEEEVEHQAVMAAAMALV